MIHTGHRIPASITVFRLNYMCTIYKMRFTAHMMRYGKSTPIQDQLKIYRMPKCQRIIRQRNLQLIRYRNLDPFHPP